MEAVPEPRERHRVLSQERVGRKFTGRAIVRRNSASTRASPVGNGGPVPELS